MAFRIGQKVVKTHNNAESTCFGVRKGMVFTVAGFCPAGHEAIGIFLCEVTVQEKPENRCTCFDQRSFRPVQSTDTGMAILEQIRRDVSNKTALPIREDEQA